MEAHPVIKVGDKYRYLMSVLARRIKPLICPKNIRNLVSH